MTDLDLRPVLDTEDAVPRPASTPGTVRLDKPGTPTDAVPGRTVLEGVIVPAGADVPAWARTRLTVRAIATHDRTRAAARHALFVAGGTAVITRRAWDGRSAARYERMIRTAEAAGNHDEAKEWEERGQRFRDNRHRRRMELLAAPQRIAKGAIVSTGLGTGGLLALGTVLAIADHDVTEVIVPTMAVIELIRLAVIVVAIVWGPLVLIAPWLAILGLWNVGRRAGAAPGWAMPGGQRSSDGAPITPSIVVTAMRDLGIGALKTAIRGMEDSGAGMLSPIVLAGCGVEVEVLLPSGVSTEEVMNRRRKLAENLGRHEHEVFVTKAQAARTVNLWIADSGALDEPIGPSPLVLDADTSADYKAGRAPWGVDLRGDAAMLSIYQCHFLITGLSNQGKTASLRAMALWVGHDVTVEFRVADLKGIGDWSCMTGIATVLIEGPTDEHVMEATEMVEGAVAEMMWRLQQPKGTKFDPLIVIVDEAQVAYGSGAKGEDGRPFGGSKATSRYFKAIKSIHDQGRAVSVTTWEGTQDPTNENLPKRSREGNHIRAALVLGTEEQAKMALGAKAIDGGAAPHKLRQGLDKGVVVVAGDGVKLAPGQSSLTIRTHYIDDTAADEIADRIRDRRAGVTTRGAATPAEAADHLADIAEVLGSERRMRTQEVLQRLAVLNPAEYREWTFTDLRSVLDAHGAAPHKSDGQMVVDRNKVLTALAERDEQAPEDDTE